MTDWKPMSEPYPDPGTLWDQKTWIAFISGTKTYDKVHVVTLMRFHNIIVSPDEDDPTPVCWFALEVPMDHDEQESP